MSLPVKKARHVLQEHPRHSSTTQKAEYVGALARLRPPPQSRACVVARAHVLRHSYHKKVNMSRDIIFNCCQAHLLRRNRQKGKNTTIDRMLVTAVVVAAFEPTHRAWETCGEQFSFFRKIEQVRHVTPQRSAREVALQHLCEER